MGDFNVDMSDASSAAAVGLQALTTGYGLQQLVEVPTRIQGQSSTLLDLVLSSSEHLLSSCSVLQPLGTSDHHSIEASLKLGKPKWSSSKRLIWLYGRANFEAINEELVKSLPTVSSLVAAGSVDDAWGSFESSFMSTISSLIPSRRVSNFRPGLPRRWGVVCGGVIVPEGGPRLL